MGCVRAARVDREADKKQAEETKWAPVGSKIYIFFLAHIACQIAGSSQYSEITVLGKKKKKEEREGKIWFRIGGINGQKNVLLGVI